MNLNCYCNNMLIIYLYHVYYYLIFSITEVFYWSRLLSWSSVYGKKNYALKPRFLKRSWTVGWCWPMKSQTHKSSTNQLLETGWWLSPRCFLEKKNKIIGVRWFSQFENFYLVEIVFNQNVSGEKMGMLCSEVFSAFWCIYWWLAPIWRWAKKNVNKKQPQLLKPNQSCNTNPPTRNPITNPWWFFGHRKVGKRLTAFSFFLCFRWMEIPRTRSWFSKDDLMQMVDSHGVESLTLAILSWTSVSFLW